MIQMDYAGRAPAQGGRPEKYSRVNRVLWVRMNLKNNAKFENNIPGYGVEIPVNLHEVQVDLTTTKIFLLTTCTLNTTTCTIT